MLEWCQSLATSAYFQRFSFIVDRLGTTRFSRSVANLLPRLSRLSRLRVAGTLYARAKKYGTKSNPRLLPRDDRLSTSARPCGDAGREVQGYGVAPKGVRRVRWTAFHAARTGPVGSRMSVAIM
jgi:hypothetical protein